MRRRRSNPGFRHRHCHRHRAAGNRSFSDRRRPGNPGNGRRYAACACGYAGSPIAAAGPDTAAGSGDNTPLPAAPTAPPADTPAPAAPVGTGVGATPPPFVMRLADGGAVASADLAAAGRPVFMMYFATW